MELSSSRDDARATLEAILAKGMEDGIVDDAVIAANLSQRQAFWKLRDEMSAAQKPEGGSIKHDISVPVAAVPDFIAEADAAVVKLIPGSRPVPFGHLGDGNIHYNVSQPIGGNAADFLARWHEVNEVVFDIVLRMGGSISAEHGIGVLKRDELPDVKDKVAIELMRAHQGDARSARHHEPRQGAVTCLCDGSNADASRRSKTRDIADVVALWQALRVDAAVERSRPPTSRWRGGDANATVLLGRDGAAIVASVMVGHDGHRGWVYYVAVDPDHRAQGYGRTIMTAAEDWLRRAASRNCN